MDVNATDGRAGLPNVLVVADWSVDPYGIVAACRRRAAEGEVTFAIVVPAWLHGLDWAGDPNASRPCAHRQLDNLLRLTAAAGLRVVGANVGDPDPTSAIDDARADYGAGEILLCPRARRFSHPLDLASRLRRSTGLPIHEIAARPASGIRERRGLNVLRGGGHCPAENLQVA